ncbi:AAA family ATPase [Haloferax volcanii]|uniref:AAA family ATPase n=1 Tax=Haloferax volcanii TaxID=2246 RepID=UPI003853BAE7
MKLRHIEITNFRPYRDVEIDLTNTDGHIHIIEGPQGAGKTSLHRAIQWGLYGGKGAVTNYKSNFNETAATNEEEDMGVRIKFKENGRDHILEREIERFNHERPSAEERVVLIIDGDTRHEGEDANDYIRDLLPEQLKDFFFLDGEKIQDLIDDERGMRAKKDIETVLKHEAIINARDDLEALISDRFETERDRIESEREERSELDDEIADLREEKRDLKERQEELKEERAEVAGDIDATREEIERYDEELIKRLNELDDEIRQLESDKQDALEQMQQSWSDLHVGILASTIEDAVDQLRDRQARFENLRTALQKQEIVESLRKEAKEGKCPICGNGHVESVADAHVGEEVDASEVELTREITDCRRKSSTLRDAPLPPMSPNQAAANVQELRDQIRDKEGEREEVMSEYGGRPEEGQKERLESNLQSLEEKQRDLDEEWSEVRGSLEEIDDRIESKRNQKRRKDGQQAYNAILDKIEAAETAIDHLDNIRREHIEQKRDGIKDKMNDVFGVVSQSEFIRGRYQGIDFRGDPGDEDSFVLELVKTDGTRKAMEDRPPSAGETQLTALSFIFGLNEYAKYSTTIVFDTVAGRLDLQNSRAQGEFFTTLDEPIMLLVTDAELQKLEPAIEDDIGVHYRIRPTSQMDSDLKEVKRR